MQKYKKQIDKKNSQIPFLYSVKQHDNLCKFFLPRWAKRGISPVPTKFVADWAAYPMSGLVNIYPDGSTRLETSGVWIWAKGSTSRMHR
jgi:hypothetical protein